MGPEASAEVIQAHALRTRRQMIGVGAPWRLSLALLLVMCQLLVCGAQEQLEDVVTHELQYRDYRPASAGGMSTWTTSCADIRADCLGGVCGCALANLGVGGHGQHATAKEQCEDTPVVSRLVDGVMQSQTCCSWVDANGVGGTNGGW